MSEPEISHLARRLAEQNNVDWQRLTGSGPNGSVVERDVLDYLARVMAGEEALDPTPEPLPEGMESWTEVGVDSVGNYSRAPGSGDAAREASGAARLDPGRATDPGTAPEIGEDLFLLDDDDELAAAPVTDAASEGGHGLADGVEPGGGEGGPLPDGAWAADSHAADPHALAHEPGAHEPGAHDGAAHAAGAFSDGRAFVAPDDDDLLLVSDDEAWHAPEPAPPAETEGAGAWQAEPAAPAASQGEAGDPWLGGDLRLDDEPYAPAATSAPDLWETDDEGDATTDPHPAGDARDALWDEAPAPASAASDAPHAAGLGGHEDETAVDAADLAGQGDEAAADGAGLAGQGDEAATDARAAGPDSVWQTAPEEADAPVVGASSGWPGAEAAPEESLAELSDEAGFDRADIEAVDGPELDAMEETEFVADVSALDGHDADALAEVDPGDAGPAPVGAAAETLVAGALPVVRTPTLLRRNLDVSPLAAAQLACGLELGREEPLPVAPFLLRAVAKAARDVGLTGGHVALAELDGELRLRRVDDAAARSFVAVAEELEAPGTEEDEVALVAVDLSAFELDEAFLDVDAPTVTFGRILYDSDVGGYRSTLALTGSIPLTQGSRLLARVAELLAEPVRLLV